MYAKLFTSIWDGSLYGQLEASAVMMACATLCNADGVLDMTPQAIAGRTGWPIEFILEGIKQLEQPDPRSRTADEEGRRLVLLDEHRDWGWLIVNYGKYRGLGDPDTIREQTRLRVKRYRERKREVTDGNAQSRHAEAEANVEKEGIADAPPAKPPPSKRSRKAPEAFIPDAAFAFAELPDLDVEAEIAKFRDWEFKTPKSDWEATWRNWIRGAKDKGSYARRPESKVAWR